MLKQTGHSGGRYLRGTGHLLKKKVGGGKELSAYGGSLHLVDASLNNMRLEERRASGPEIQAIDDEYSELVKRNYRRQMSALEFLDKLQNASVNVKYLDGDLRGKPPWKSHQLRRSNKSYIPSLIEQSDLNYDSEPDIVTNKSLKKGNLKVTRKLSSSLPEIHKEVNGAINLAKSHELNDEYSTSKLKCSTNKSLILQMLVRPSTQTLPFRPRPRAGTEGRPNATQHKIKRRLSRSTGDLTDLEALRMARLEENMKNQQINVTDDDLLKGGSKRGNKPVPDWLKVTNDVQSDDEVAIQTYPRRRRKGTVLPKPIPAWLAGDK